ncbi:aspartyl-phosphate phosphatase Spo0E family protein [Paenibacillus larvae]
MICFSTTPVMIVSETVYRWWNQSSYTVKNHEWSVVIIKALFNEKHICLIEKIESVRQQLVQAANEKKTFTDIGVVTLSQELDTYLLEYQKLPLKTIFWIKSKFVCKFPQLDCAT